MAKYSYPAIKVQQTETGPATVLFGANAVDIFQWAGIPQKKVFEDQDSTGFQRTFDEKRESDLLAFFKDQSNTLQNPLMCATHGLAEKHVQFVPTEGALETEGAISGTLEIDDTYLENQPLVELFNLLKRRLERRVSRLQNARPREERLAAFRAALNEKPGGEDPGEEDAGADSFVTEEAEPPPQEALVDFDHDSMVDQFWEDIAIRAEVLGELGGSDKDNFGGYSRDTLLSYVRPVVLVDGQHRLRGAVKYANEQFDKNSAFVVQELPKFEGLPNEQAENRIKKKWARRLPVSMLLSDDPAEHVFQFVVVNQKATPVGKALLGTIISTTLSEEELDRVSNRLENAKIPLEDSRAVTYMATNADSPFYGLVNRGMKTKGDNSDLLEWSVVLQLINIFRRLGGAKLLTGESNSDFAKIWATRYLIQSKIVSGTTYAERLEQWSAFDGAWRAVFMMFFNEIRTRFGSEDQGTLNVWRNPRESQLFNKPSLLILTTDFFKFLVDAKHPLLSVDDVPQKMDLWLEGVSTTYFQRTWGGKDFLSGVKKDAPQTKRRWARLWYDYRTNPEKLPELKSYRSAD